MALMAAKDTITEALEYYANLLIQQYRDKDRARATIKAFTRQVMGDNIILDVANAYNVDTAIGRQMNVVAKYVGAARTIPVAVIDDKPYFNFYSWEEDPALYTHGFASWEDSSQNAENFFYTYASSLQNKRDLTDTEMGLFIKMRIAINTADGSYSGIVSYLNEFFGNKIVCLDNEDMTLTYYVADSAPFTVEALQAYLPRPMGVSMNITVVPTVNGVMMIPKQYVLIDTDTFEGRPLATLVEQENLFEPTSCGNNWSYLHVGVDMFEGIPVGSAESVLALRPTSALSPARILEGVCVRFPAVEDVEEFASYAVGTAGDMVASGLYFLEGTNFTFNP